MENFNIYDYVNDGKGGKSAYEILEEFIGVDLSAKSIILSALPIYRDPNNLKWRESDIKKVYLRAFDMLSETADDIFTPEEIEQILKSANEVNPELKFANIGECKSYLRENFKDKRVLTDFSIEDYDKVNSIYLGSIIDKLEENLLNEKGNIERDEAALEGAKSLIYSYFVFPIINNTIREVYPYQREKTEYESRDLLTRTASYLSNSKKMCMYDRFLRDNERKIREARESITFKNTCEAKREEPVAETIVPLISSKTKPSNPKVPEQEQVSETNQNKEVQPEETIEMPGYNKYLFEPRDNNMPRKGSFDWRFMQYAEPEIFCEGIADYSEEGMENQTVVAVRYGRFDYQDKIIRSGSSNLELIGVTRLGIDGSHTYFVVMPLDQLQLVSELDRKPNDRVVDIFGNGGEFPDQFGFIKYSFIKARQMPPEQKEFYLKYIFSDKYLETIKANNFSFVGHLIESKDSEKGFVISPFTDQLGLDTDLNFCKYALGNPGVVEKKTASGKKISAPVKSLKQIINSTQLHTQHLTIVSQFIRDPRDTQKENETGEIEWYD